MSLKGCWSRDREKDLWAKQPVEIAATCFGVLDLLSMSDLWPLFTGGVSLRLQRSGLQGEGAASQEMLQLGFSDLGWVGMACVATRFSVTLCLPVFVCGCLRTLLKPKSKEISDCFKI